MSESSLPTMYRRKLSEPKTRRRLLAGLGVLLVLAGVALGTGALGGAGAKNSSGVVDNTAPTALATVRETSLSSQTESAGTLGYAGSFTVAVPGGTAPAAVQQARQAAAAAAAQVRSAQATLESDRSAYAKARSTLAGDRAKKAIDCRRNGVSGSSTSDASSGGSCPASTQTVASDEQTIAADGQKVIADRGQLNVQQQSLAAARQNLASAETSATIYDTGAAYTTLPRPGETIRRGQALYGVDDRPIVLLYGRSPAWRAFRSGITPGPDVAELNANLRGLGYVSGPANRFSAATARGIDQLQVARGMSATGELPLGSIVFTAGAVRVAGVTPDLGSTVQPGPVMRLTSTRHQVSVQLDPSLQADVKTGDRVTVTLPDNSTTPGVISAVGKVATTPPSSGSGGNGPGSSNSPTIQVDVRLLHEASAGNLDQAPVQVAITTASVQAALVVPVGALLALAGGGYALETVTPTGAHQLIAARVGLFDDASGLVQVSGSTLHAGQRVVVPAS